MNPSQNQDFDEEVERRVQLRVGDAIKAMAADGGLVDVPIPLLDGSFELLTQAKAAALWAALKDMERTLLVRLRDRVQDIDAATTQAQVEAVTW